MSAVNVARATCTSTNFLDELNCGAGSADSSSGESVGALAAAIVSSFGSAGAQILIFLILRLRLSRIYRPRSYLVPERERVPVPPSGVIAWLGPLFTTPNLAFIQKCGLDAYFFLRYLRLLLKIFVPLALLILPILLPINRFSGHVEKGLDRLSISNISPRYLSDRLWAHLILALVVIAWVSYVLYDELRTYIRVRQAFLTSPQHRIRASATTVLVSGIPQKWLTLEALNGLYDVFPGGIRNIWINRNYDDLATKVKYRHSLAKSLESAETNLIRLCWNKHQKAEEERRKKGGEAKLSKEEKKQERADADAAAEEMAQAQGVSAGDQEEVPFGLQEAVEDADAGAEEDESVPSQHPPQRRPTDPLGYVGDGFGKVGKGLGALGRGVGGFGQRIVGDVDSGFRKTAAGVDSGFVNVNKGAGFAVDDDLYASPDLAQDVPPTPPPKTQMDRQLKFPRAQGDRGLRIVNDSQAQDRPQAAPTADAREAGRTTNVSPASDTTRVPSGRATGASVESPRVPKSPFQIELPPDHQSSKRSFWKFWQNDDQQIALPSPQPHTAEEEEFPLTATTVRTNTCSKANDEAENKESSGSWATKLMFWKSSDGDEESGDEEPKEEYVKAFNADCDEDQDGNAVWRRYIEPKERETMRVPIFSPTWCPALPFIGKEVDRIYWTRRELARMNLEIESDQDNVEKFPYMNSAFIQFNHQVAAHMACQSVSHHVPQQMTPRIVEISPDDVLWGNMSIKWWERYIRGLIVLVVCVALIILYAVPVSFTSLLSKIDILAEDYSWLAWLAQLPAVIISILEGVLPAVLLSIILTLVPVIFRLLVRQQGVPTGTGRELYVQQYYFTFLFIQVFLVVSITSGLTKFVTQISTNPTKIFTLLADDLPTAADYFFSYLTVQAISNSASALLQVWQLICWLILAPLLDSTARAKWRRHTHLSTFHWGSFFPPFTNFAVIGIVYSVIAPLILFFMIIIFGVFWIVYRYNVLYVYRFRHDTGGLLFPVAVNQLFTGLYVLELCMVGIFFSKRNQNDDVACVAQGVIMVVALVATIAYQVILNSAFKPLLRYLPITLEDEAVIRDEEFARAQASKFNPGIEDDGSAGDDAVFDEVEDDDHTVAGEKGGLERRGTPQTQVHLTVETPRRARRASGLSHTSAVSQSVWHRRDSQSHSVRSPETWKTDRWRLAPDQAVHKMRHMAHATTSAMRPPASRTHRRSAHPGAADVEAQNTIGDVLFSGFADELEDLTPDERDVLVRYAFQHAALRARRPVVWIPRDHLGVSDDEIARSKMMSTVSVPDPLSATANGEGRKEEKAEDGQGASGEARSPAVVEKTNIWMSNDGTALDGKGKVVFRRSPPDFSNVDLIAL